VHSFGKYRLEERLGEGGMAVVWRAKLYGPGGFQKTLVVKQIRDELAKRPEFIDLFVAEAKLTVSLTHANIVPVYELGMVEETYFLALELVDGPPLSKLIEEGPVPPPLSAYIVEQVLRGLHYAHRHGVVHRDLSSANVLCSRDGEVKIVDFGIAAPAAARGVVGGSRGYIAPEQERGGVADARSDLYAVGVLLWELVQGGRYTGAKLGVPALQEIVARATDKDPNSRYADAAEMLGAVSRFLRSATGAMTQAELGALVRRRAPDLPPPRPDNASEEEGENGNGTESAKPNGNDESRTKLRQVTFATRIAPPARSKRRVLIAASILAVASAAAVTTTRLSHRQAPAPAPAAPPPIAEATAPAPTAASTTSPSPAPPRVARKRAVAHGELTLGAVPWAHVTVDGEARPDTPLRKLALAAGKHEVHLVCPPTGKELRFSVQIDPGKETRKVADLRAEPRLVEGSAAE
jgi:serine/threonine-protein kinase